MQPLYLENTWLPIHYKLQIILRGHILWAISHDPSNSSEAFGSTFLPCPIAMLHIGAVGMEFS